MFFTSSYEFEKCIEKDCKLCPQRAECIHFTPEEEYPPQEEYRMFISPLDDTSGELIRSIAKKISRSGYPEREILKLVVAWYLCGYQVKDLLILISRGYHPLEIERYVEEVLKYEFREYLAELIEREGDPDLLDDLDLLEEQDFFTHPRLADFLARLRIKNFTGEVRLGPPEEEPQEEHIPPEVQKLIDEALRLASSVKYARTGRYAYLFSQKCKEAISQLPPDWAEVVRYRLKKAWEERKSSHAKK